MSESVIRTEKLTKFYGRHRGIEDLDLTVSEGEIFGFIGPNGAGKTTTIRTLLNLIFPTSGKAEIFGLDVVSRTRDIKKGIGYVPSEVKYYPGMSVNELLRYSASFYGISDMTRAWSLAERLDLERSRRIEDLSTGNAKKVALVQSLIHAPRLLILDEPTNYTALYVPLLGSIFSITVTASILHKEQAQGTAEFLIAKPLSRGEVVRAKMGAYVVLILTINAAAFLAGWLCLAAFAPSPFSRTALLVIHVYGLAIMLAMGGIGLLVSQIAKMTTRYDALGWVSPFKLMDLDVTRAGYGFTWWRLTAFVVLIAATFTAAALLYRKKDILA